MKRFIVLLAILTMVSMAAPVMAMGPLMVSSHTAAWDREADTPGIYTVSGYYIYWRVVHTPVNPWVNTQRSALVSQPAVGIVPTYDLTALGLANGNYELCATAIDTKGDESGPSNIVPFTWAIPVSLTNFVIQ